MMTDCIPDPDCQAALVLDIAKKLQACSGFPVYVPMAANAVAIYMASVLRAYGLVVRVQKGHGKNPATQTFAEAHADSVKPSLCCPMLVIESADIRKMLEFMHQTKR